MNDKSAIGFINGLKELLIEIQTTGGSSLHYKGHPKKLQAAVRKRLIKMIKGRQTIQLGFLETKIFYNLVKTAWLYCISLGITEKQDLENLIGSALSILFIDKFEELQVNEISSLVLWRAVEKGGNQETRYYDYCQKLMLIERDTKRPKWKLTIFGKWLLEMSVYPALVFLLTLETTLASINSGGRELFPAYISKSFLERVEGPYDYWEYRILDIDRDEPIYDDMISVFDISLLCATYDYPSRLFSLFWALWRKMLEFVIGIGLFEVIKDYFYGDGEIRKTLLGKKVITAVLAEDNPWKGVIETILTSQNPEMMSSLTPDWNDGAFNEKSSQILDENNRKAIATSLQLYQKKQYNEALRVFFPTLEMAVNKILLQCNRRPDEFRGMGEKLSWLKENKIIRREATTLIDIVNFRNQIVHGNSSVNDDWGRPSFELVFYFFRKLIDEYAIRGGNARAAAFSSDKSEKAPYSPGREKYGHQPTGKTNG